MYYDKHGNEISVREWQELNSSGKYRRVDETRFSDGVHVSTVWIGTDVSLHPANRPAIFETMVWSEEGGPYDYHIQRYGSLEDAQEGHEEICEKIRSGSDLLAV